MRRDLAIVIQLGLAFAFIFSAFNSQGLIEISVLRKLAEISPSSGIDENSGYYSLSIIYFVFTFCNLLVPAIVNKLGAKWSQVLGASLYLTFMLSFLKLNSYFLYIGSAGLGFGAALLWTGNGSYLVTFSRNGKLQRNSGILWAMLQSSLIAGGIFLIFVLKSEGLADSYKLVYGVFSAVSAVGIVLLVLLPSYPPYDQQFEEVYERDQEYLIESQNESFAPGETFVSLKQQVAKTFSLLMSPDMLLLSITFLYTGFEMTFYTGVYTGCLSATTELKSYSDLIIPYNAFALGIGQITGGIFTGSLAKKLNISRAKIILIGMIGHIVAFFLCILILPFDSTIHKSELPTYVTPNLVITLVIAFLLGLSDSCWQTQVYVILGELCANDSINAFAVFKFFQSLAACISFYYSAHLFLHWQLIILIVGCFMSTIFYLRVEYKLDVISNQPL